MEQVALKDDIELEAKREASSLELNFERYAFGTALNSPPLFFVPLSSQCVCVSLSL